MLCQTEEWSYVAAYHVSLLLASTIELCSFEDSISSDDEIPVNLILDALVDLSLFLCEAKSRCLFAKNSRENEISWVFFPRKRNPVFCYCPDTTFRQTTKSGVLLMSPYYFSSDNEIRCLSFFLILFFVRQRNPVFCHCRHTTVIHWNTVVFHCIHRTFRHRMLSVTR